MKRWLLLWMALPFVSIAQEPLYVWTSVLLMNENWPRPTVEQPDFSFFADIIVVEKSDRVDNNLQFYSCSRAIWLRESSWMADSIEGTHRPLAQLYFDCYELEARKISRELQKGGIDPNELAHQARLRADSLANHFNSITAAGVDFEQLRLSRLWMDSALQANPRMDFPEKPEKKVLGLGFDIGVGATFFTGEVSSYFKPVSGLSLGGTFRINRLYFDYHWLNTRTIARKEFEMQDFKFTDTTSLRIRQTVAAVGFQVTRFSRLRLVPYVALSLFRVINDNEPKGSLYNKGGLSSNFGIGLLSEWTVNPYDPRERSFWKIILRTEYTRIDYLHVIQGDGFKVLLGIGIAI